MQAGLRCETNAEKLPKSPQDPQKTSQNTSQTTPKQSKIEQRHPQTTKNRLKTQTTKDSNTTTEICNIDML